MNNLQIFENSEFGQIRAIEQNGAPWFIGKDVADVLEYSNTPKAIRDHVDESDKLTERIVLAGQNREVILINESGLYSLILSSKMPRAKAFKHWVTAEVLPSIRKHGAYMNEETIQKALTSPDFLISLANNLKAEQEARRKAEAAVEAARPKVIFADAVSVSGTNILIGELAKILKQNGVDIGQNRLFEWMRNNGYLIRRRGTDYNMPTQMAMDLELFTIKETVITHSDGHTSISKTVKVTGKGQQYFINKFLRR